ncbi:MAG TPA: tetratricopeptide repeat protein [Longimicrobiales bacterium]|nr:tetratricopeptide repeat protein [Longimicrobiales bacterium]
MKQTGRINLVLLLLLLMPGIAFAQRDTKETREASKYIGLAMTKQEPAEQADMYRQAMEHLRPAMTSDAENAKVWLLAGTALAALGEIQEADQAFIRAQQLNPDYADQIMAERESAWVVAFNQGIQLMDQQQYPEAIAALEAAQSIYSMRPEGLMNLGALYANSGEHEKAEQALVLAIEATQGPLFETLQPEQQAEWVRFRAMAKANIGQIQAQQGIVSFEAEQFDSAAARFLRAAETNPQARDYWFNYGQALWAMTTPLEESLATATPPDSARIGAQLTELYGKIQAAAQKSREFDPNNEVLYLMEARTHRMGGDISGDEAKKEAGHQAALKLLEAHDALTVLVDEVSALPDAEGNVQIRGVVKNVKAAEGSTVTLKFTLLDSDGAAIGQQDVTVTVPAADMSVPFEATTTAEGEVAGWKYVIG